jgi:hypothetical protein
MQKSSGQAKIAGRTNGRVALVLLIAPHIFACAGSDGDGSRSASAGNAHGGSSAGGASGAGQGGASGSSGSPAGGGTSGSSASRASGGTSGSSGSQTCGDRTCGNNEYCRAPCSGTGLGGTQSLGDPTCTELPAGCNGVPTCDCICDSVGFCTPGGFEVQCGCA